MGLKPAVLCLLKCKGKCIKGFVSAQPYKTAISHINVRLVTFSVTGTNAAIQSITGNHQVGLVLCSQDLVVHHIIFKYQLHVNFFTTLLQDIEQVFSSYTAKTVAC